MACDQNKLIGNSGKLPWNIPEDWEYFLKTTHGGVLIMGRRCYLDFEEYAKHRHVIGLSRNPNYHFPHADKASSLIESLKIAKKTRKIIWICGGKSIYQEALPLADRLYLTEINAEFTGDVYLPAWEMHFKKELSNRFLKTNTYELSFRILTK